MRKERTMNQHPGVLDWREKTDDKIDEPFNMAELKRAINKAKPTSPGKDQICYVMLKTSRERSALKVCCTFITECGRREDYRMHGKKQ